ncbi:MAG: hypothetical protein EKK61_01420 [Rickettsiales bacterium]|nr:MAG: hypothetical protein EKK61_01420 [Rickettsiales bacterium]
MSDSKLDFEIQRKIFHLYSLIFPVAYIFISKSTMCIALTIITAIALYLDISRHYNPKIKTLVANFFGRFLREEENNGQFAFSGASYMACGFLLTCLLFNKGLAINSWFILIISDCFAAIVGLKYGSPLFNGKTLAGSISFFVSAVFISILTYFVIGYRTTFIIIIVSSFVVTIIEFFSKEIKINDNFSIPVSYALITTILSWTV